MKQHCSFSPDLNRQMVVPNRMSTSHIRHKKRVSHDILEKSSPPLSHRTVAYAVEKKIQIRCRKGEPLPAHQEKDTQIELIRCKKKGKLTLLGAVCALFDEKQDDPDDWRIQCVISLSNFISCGEHRRLLGRNSNKGKREGDAGKNSRGGEE